MDFAWSDQQRELLNAVGRFASQQLNYDVIENDREGIFNHEAWKKCGDFGIQGLLVPSDYGGLGTDPLTTVAALERLGYACRDNGLLFSINAHMWTAIIPLVYNGSEAQKKKYLPGLSNGTLIGGNAMSEPNSGSDAFSLSTTAIKKGSTYILNGSKIFVTNGPIADLLVVFATVDKMRGPDGITAFLVEKNSPGMNAARKLMSWLKQNPQPKEFIDAARVLIFLKGRDAHDYKFSSAVLEDYQNVGPAWRDRYLAASVFILRGSGDSNNDLVKRARAALQG